MFNIAIFYREVGDLMHQGEGRRAEELMLRTYSELKFAGNPQELEPVACQLAQYYSMPEWEDLKKAEMYFLQCEALSPGACTKRQTASFYLYTLRDPAKAIKKVDEIKLFDVTSGWARACYYTALGLRGQALLDLGMADQVGEVMDSLLASFCRKTPFFCELPKAEDSPWAG